MVNRATLSVSLSGNALPFLQGFSTGLGLIVAIGAQNALVLRQGLRRQYVTELVILCAVSDALLILAGVLGLGVLVSQNPSALVVIQYGGAAFLTLYGALALRRVWKAEGLEVGDTAVQARLPIVLSCLAMTFLNPHVYLDTVVLLGGLSAQFAGQEKKAYTIGAMIASFTWFSALGYGARLLVPLFRRPAAWRVLDALIALVMFTLAAVLITSDFSAI